ncbi:MAG: hypothetical protein ACTHMT_07480 [Verrucomicrobiota bacterium]
MNAFLERYRLIVDELGLIELREAELRIFRAVLDYSLGVSRHELRVTMKKDLEFLTGIELKNLLRPIEALKRAGMLLYWETSTGYVFQVVADPSFWISAVRRFDRLEYYRALNGIKAHNAFADPDPHLPTLAPEKGLNEVLADGARTEFASINSPGQACPGGCDYDRAGAGDDQPNGNSNGSTKGAVGSEVAAVPVGGAAHASADLPNGSALEEVRTSSPPNFPTNGKGSLWREVERIAEAEREPVLNFSTQKKISPLRDAQSSDAVLNFSTGKPAKPPDEYLNLVPASGGVLNFSTPIYNNVHCNNASSKKHLTLFIKAVRDGQVVLHREVSRRELAKWLESAGVFAGPNGENYAPFWWKAIRHRKGDVENCFFDLIQRVKEEGTGAVESPGTYMAHRFYAMKGGAK